MTIPDPPWKRKTRPCPFYSQGRCLFSDSCNFLHEVKIKVKTPEIAIISSPTPQSTPALSRTNSLSSSPGSPSSLRRVRSPPRSPRLSSLLLALGDAIEPEEAEATSDEDFGVDEDDTARPEDLVPPDALLGKVLRRRSTVGVREHEGGGSTGAVEEAVNLATDAGNVDSPSEDLPPKAAFDLVLRQMSSLGVVNDLNAKPVEETVPSEELVATDSFMETSSTSSEAPAPSHGISGPSSMSGHSGRAEGSDLMSPVELTMAPPFWHPIGQLPQPHHHEDSMDSGYADNWSGPTPFALSPPNKESSKRLSTLSLLSSPFGSPVCAISPKFGPPTLSGWPTSPRASTSDQGQPSERDQDVSVIALNDDLDSPTKYAAERRRQSSSSQASSVFIDLESTVKQSIVHSLHQEDSDTRTAELGVPSMMSLVIPSDSLPTPSFSTSSVFSLPHAPQTQPDEPTATELGSSHSSDVNTSSSVFSLPPTALTEASSPDPSSHTGSPALFVGHSDQDALDVVPPSVPPTASVLPYENLSDEQESLDDDVNLYGSYYQEIPVSDISEHSTPQLTRSLSRAASLRSGGQKTTGGLPSAVRSPAGSVASTSSISLLKESLPSFDPDVSPGSVPSSSSHVESNVQHVLASPRVFRDVPLSAPPPGRDEPISPYGIISPVQASSVPSSPSTSTMPSASDSAPRIEPIASRRSSKVPFGFRHSVVARKRESLITPRPGSAPLVRHRPPALVGISSNRSNSMNDSRPDLASPMESIPSANKLRPLRLSVLLNSPSSSLSFNSAISPSPLSSGMFSQQTADITPATSHPPASPSVHSDRSLSNKSQSSPASSHSIPSNILSNTLIPIDATLTLDGSERNVLLSPSTFSPSAPWDATSSPSTSYASHRLSQSARPSSRLSEPIHPILEDDREDFDDEDYSGIEQSDLTIRGEAIPSPPYPRPSSTTSYHEPVHAIATPRPTLLFAIASDNVDEVRKVLESGEAGPNDDVGPQSALAFTLTANNLKHKADIVKTLLAHGANPSSIRPPQVHSAGSSVSSFGQATNAGPARPDVLAGVDPATRYYIARADAPQTRRASSLIHRSFFQPLAKVRYDLVGQDRALEQLFRVLSMPSMAPIVVLLCGPSGHGKSLLARRFGSLLDVPTHTVNMTTLCSTRDIWRSYSMNPYEASSDLTLSDFLMENEGKRCVVVLDEIEKTENETILSSLLMPWELGRVSFEAGHRHVDCSKVIWLGTSNIGHDMVFEHQASRTCPDEQMSRDEYVDLMKLLRPKVSERLGPSLLSRVTTVLPFVPFTPDEKLAIATEALFALTEDARTIPSATVEKLVRDSLQSYVPAEGARSLYRAVSTLLLDML